MRFGNQEPTFSTKIEYASTDGPEVVEWFESIGHRFYPCRAYEMCVFCARDASGDFAYRTICISKPRQNGKSYSARDYSVDKAAIEGMNVCYSAHHSKTTHKMFKEMLAIFEGDDELRLMIADVSRARGFEGIWLTNGGCIEFYTRSTRSGGGRGTTYDIIVVDEAQEMTEDEQDALKPTQIASDSGDPQMILIGTPPGPSCMGTVFKTLHDRAHANPELCGFAWIEWAVYELPDMEGDRTHVLELAYMTNPAMGYRIRESVMLDVINTATSVDGFAREYLGWWSPIESAIHPIKASDWEACEVDSMPDGEPVAYAVKFSPDGNVGTIAVCTDSEPPFVEVVANRSMRRGVTWFARWIADRQGRVEAVVIDGKSNAQTLNDKLVEGAVDPDLIVRPSTADVIAANTAFVDATKERSVCHAGQPALVDSATKSLYRKIGRDGGFGFDSTDNADATMVEACALAYWCASSIRRNPLQELRIG